MLRALVQVVAVKSDGATSPASAPASFTTSPAAAPTLTNVQATSPTTGTATAVPPPGITYISYTFTVVPLNGGAPITVTSSSAAGAIPGLTPGTQARHCSVPALVSVCAEQLASKHSRQHSLCTPTPSHAAVSSDGGGHTARGSEVSSLSSSSHDHSATWATAQF